MKKNKLSILLLLVLSFACTRPAIISTPQATIAAPGSVLFEDDFSHPETGWDHTLADEGIMDYDAGGYRILVNSLQTNFWSTSHQNFSNVQIEVDAGKLAGPDENRIGLVCRFNGSDYYFFIISSDGFYGMGVYSGGQALLLGQSEMQASSSINKGLAVNHLRADCTGNTLTFYINGLQVAQTQDSTLTTGGVGLLAGTFATPGVDVIFDNFVVLQP